jgi:tripartite ATP-independent transporter DctP family solute receptor
MRRSLSRRSVLAMSAACLAAPHVARAAVRTVKLAQGSAPSSPPGVGAVAFAEAVASNPILGPVLKLEVHHNAELGDDLTALRGCIDGTLDLAIVGTTVASSIVPEIGVLDTPFLFQSVVAARRALDVDLRQDFVDILMAKGISLLAWGENGVRHVTANKPVRKPADLAGLKLRVPPSEVIMSAFRALGATPGQTPFPAVYEALRTGTFDAEENPIGLIESAKFYEVQKVLSLTRHAYSAALCVVSPDLLDDLSGPQRAALQTCAQAAQTGSREAADAAQRDGVARLQAKGMIVISNVDVPSFIEASRANLAGMGTKFGAERMAKLIRAGSS